jgi:hypothetical protein
MKKNVTKRPNGLTPAERKAWDDIVREMESRGIDPKGRVALIKDYVKLESRIERLSNRVRRSLPGFRASPRCKFWLCRGISHRLASRSRSSMIGMEARA